MLKFIQENLAALIGAFIPVLGSVFLIHYGDYSNEKRKNKLFFRRACELIKYNIEIAHARIINKTSDIAFAEEDLREVLNDMESISLKYSKRIYNDLFDLVFTIRTGEQLSMNYSKFHEIVFKKTRKGKSNFMEFAKIIESVGIDEVYEFKVLKQLILFSLKMEIDTVFNSYYHLLKQVNKDISIDTAIRYYMVELLIQSDKGISNQINFISYALEEGLLNEIKSISIDEEKQLNGKELDRIAEQLDYYKNIIQTFHADPIWKIFLNGINEESVTLQSDHIEEIQKILTDMYNEDENVYLSFMGINDNGDALDNNGRSRQKEYLDHVTSQPYIMQSRSWYKEAIADGDDDVTITFPYIDTSKSFVVSFVKKVYINDTIKGVVGLDVLMEELLNKAIKNDSRKLVFFTSDGEIIFDTTKHKSAKKLFFNNILFNADLSILELMKHNRNGFIKNKQRESVYFATIVKDKYYCVIH